MLVVKNRTSSSAKKYLTHKFLKELYVEKKNSTAQIAKIVGCSEHKVNYWLLKHTITKRSISEAVYARCNPDGDPFSFVHPHTREEAKLFGVGIGLYWGEGNKANKNIVKLGNSDPALIRTFIKFLTTFFRISEKDLRFHLHTFTDIDMQEAIRYWMREIGFSRDRNPSHPRESPVKYGKMNAC